MNKNTFGNILMSLNPMAALAAFYSVSRAIRIPESSTWIVPMVWVSIFIVSIFLVALFVRSRVLAESVIAASLLSSVIFAFSFAYLGVILIAIALVLAGVHGMRKDLDLNVKINLWKSLYIGKFRIILALAILISGQYYFTIKSMDEPVNVPKFEISEISGPLIQPILGIVNPEFAKAGSQGMTVDQFIVQSQKNQEQSVEDEEMQLQIIEQNMPTGITEKQKEILKKRALAEISDAKLKMTEQNQQLILIEGRKQFSKIAGKKIVGDEKVSDVFIGMINERINSYFQPSMQGEKKSSFYSLILTTILFLTIWPLGSLLSTLWFAIVILLFKGFVRFGLVEIKKVTVEREKII